MKGESRAWESWLGGHQTNQINKQKPFKATACDEYVIKYTGLDTNINAYTLSSEKQDEIHKYLLNMDKVRGTTGEWGVVLKKAHSRGHIVAIFSLVSNTAWRNYNTKQAKRVNDNLVLPLSLNNYANTSQGGI